MKILVFKLGIIIRIFHFDKNQIFKLKLLNYLNIPRSNIPMKYQIDI